MDGERRYKTYINIISKSWGWVGEMGVLINMFRQWGNFLFFSFSTGVKRRRDGIWGRQCTCPWCPRQLHWKGKHKEKEKEKKKPTLKLLNALYIVHIYIYIFIHVNLVYSILIVIFSVPVDFICRFFIYCDYYIIYVYVRLQS